MSSLTGGHRLFEARCPSRDAALPNLRIAVVFREQRLETIRAHDMSVIRWLRMSEALSYTGLSVDVIAWGDVEETRISPTLRLLPAGAARWDEYHAIKTLFHKGFDALRRHGGDAHPMIISKLGSVVGSREDEPGVHFSGEERDWLFGVQEDIARSARYVTVLTEPSRDLWLREHPSARNVLLVPTGVDRHVPPPGDNPYPDSAGKVAVFIGNFYSDTQRAVNLLWQGRFNEIGAALASRGIRFFVVGKGRTDQLDPAAVTYLGPVDHHRVWDYQYHADAGLVLAQGPQQHNESSKIYYYLRTGLPVVSESPVPNNHVIEQAGLGYVVPLGDTGALADRVEAAVNARWDRERAIDYILREHTWDRRVETYARLLCRELAAA